MTLARIPCECLLVVMLIGIFGCNRRYEKPTIYVPVPYTLTIDEDCEVNSDWRPVHIKDQIMWNAPDAAHAYSVKFHHYAPFGSTTTAGPIEFSAGHPQTVTGGTKCPDPGNTSAAIACYFPYDVLRDEKKCGDPGVHVTPTGGNIP
jgi:hypothetical protein